MTKSLYWGALDGKKLYRVALHDKKASIGELYMANKIYWVALDDKKAYIGEL